MKKSCLPNLIVIGAMKCATTSLHYYLGLHPEIQMSKQKELNYFTTNSHRGLAWYQSHFTEDVPICGESSTNYTMYPLLKGGPASMHAVIPEAQLIIIVRDPITRLISHYMHEYAAGFDTRTLADALRELDNNPYVLVSKYYMQIEQYLAYYPAERILVLTTEELYAHRPETLSKAFSFLGVDPSFKCKKFSKLKHITREKRRLNKIGQLLRNASEKHLNPYYPGTQRYLVNLLCYPFSQRMKRAYLDDSLRQELEHLLRDDYQKLRAFMEFNQTYA
jgi:hypothetical protein